MEEIWKDAVGYEGLYQVSNYGRVKSLNYNHTGKEKILKPKIDGGGYLRVCLCKLGKPKKYKVHRLVLMTFQPVENMSELDVDHINTIRLDNRLENLRWTTRKENCNNPLTKLHLSKANKGENNPMYGRTGENNPCYGKRGTKNHNSIPIAQLTLEGELVEVYRSSYEAERKGFNIGNINHCIKGKRKTHKNYKWKYLYEYISGISPNIKQINLFGKTYEVNQ